VVLGGDPVAAGLVTSLARPGGNLTGLKSLSGPGSVKGVELLKEIVPGLHHLAFMRDAGNPATVTGSIPAVREVAKVLGLAVLELDVQTAAEVPSAIAMATSWGAAGLYLALAPRLEPLISSIVRFGADNHLPGAYVQREYVAAGGLLWYGTRLSALFRRSATFVDKILRGSAMPRELPIEEATLFDLTINVTTAQALGLTIPPTVVSLVTEWIQ
jgi:putative ABC transport system substrate-binding protein